MIRAPSLAFDMEVLYTLYRSASSKFQLQRKGQHLLDILDNIDLSLVLAKGADTDTMRAITHQPLNDNVGAVGLERDTIVAIIDIRVLDDDAVRSIRVPSVRVLGGGRRDAE